MKHKTPHEPQEQVMSAREAIADADRLETLLKQNTRKAKSTVRRQIPFASFLDALDTFQHDELVILQERLAELLDD